MGRTAANTDFHKTPVQIVDLVLDRCTLTHGTAPCTSTAGWGAECYKTYETCLDQANYSKGSKTYRLTRVGTPEIKGGTFLSCVLDVKTSATVIDTKKGLGPREKVTILCRDFKDNDVQTDPHYRRRPDKTERSFFLRLLRRNKHLAGRWLHVLEGYLDPDGGITESNFVTRYYIIEGISEPSAKGEVEIVAKDPFCLLENVMIPQASEGELTATLTAGGASCSVTAGTGADYGTPPFYVFIDEELIKVTARTTDSFGTIVRAQGNTTAAQHEANAKVQLVKSWEAANFDTVWSDILNDGGVSSTYRDDAGAATVRQLWLTAPHTAYIVKPTRASVLLKDLMRVNDAVSWWDRESQVASVKPLVPIGPADTVTSLDETAHVAGDSVETKRIHPRRITRGTLHYAILSWDKELREAASYARHIVTVDANAESANEYGDEIADDDAWGYFMPTSERAFLLSTGQRIIDRHRDAPRWVKFDLEAKDAEDLKPGEYVLLSTDQIVDVTGAPTTIFLMLTRKQKTAPTAWTFEGEQADFVSYGYWVADTHPDYGSCTDLQERQAGFWGGADDEYSVWI